MRIAVVGSGIAGLAAAWYLQKSHEVTLFEAADYLGGHTHTHDIELGGSSYRVDTGFIVHNPVHYPLLHRLFEELRVASQPTTMSFSVHNPGTGLEYNATTLDSLFCQRRNLVSPRFLRMVRDLLRFYRETPAVLDAPAPGPTLGEYLAQHRYGDAFRDEHIVPMASALWSAPPAAILSFPMQYLVHFLANHQMLQTADRPQWQVVRNGSNTYVEAMRRDWHVSERVGCAVTAVRREADRVVVSADGADLAFDHVVLACHADQALRMLRDPSHREHEILGAIRFGNNATTLHTDASVMPRDPKAWAAWNVQVGPTASHACNVTYCMNLLQGLSSPEPLLVSLNQDASIDPAKVLRRMAYAHPTYDAASVAARARKAEIQGQRRTWYAGAYWGWGFHEDGMRSAVEIARSLDAIQASTSVGDVVGVPA